MPSPKPWTLRVFLMRFLPQGFPLLRCLLGKGRVKHRFFQQQTEIQCDQHLGGNLLFQVRITRALREVWNSFRTR